MISARKTSFGYCCRDFKMWSCISVATLGGSITTTANNRDDWLVIFNVMNWDFIWPSQGSRSAGQKYGSLTVTADVAGRSCWGSWSAMALLPDTCLSCRLRVTTCNQEDDDLSEQLHYSYRTPFCPDVLFFDMIMSVSIVACLAACRAPNCANIVSSARSVTTLSSPPPTSFSNDTVV